MFSVFINTLNENRIALSFPPPRSCCCWPDLRHIALRGHSQIPNQAAISHFALRAQGSPQEGAPIQGLLLTSCFFTGQGWDELAKSNLSPSIRFEDCVRLWK